MRREIARERPLSRMRIWTAPDAPAGAEASPVTVEWAGLIGHPTTYALLGGRVSSGATDIEVVTDGSEFGSSLAAGRDHVCFGLPDEYRPGVFAGAPAGIIVTVAAHAYVSSSQRAFRMVASVLATLLREGVPNDDEELWALLLAARELHLMTPSSE